MVDTNKNILENNLKEYNEFDHLIKLLDDEDENIYTNIKDRFISHGNQSSNFLLNYINDENILIKKRANEIVSILNFDIIIEKFKALKLRKESDILEEGIFLIASFGIPWININHYKSILNNMVSEIRSQLIKINMDINQIKPVEILNTFNNYLFIEKGFKGNTENYYEEENSFINNVLDSKLGNPISLCIIYILIARKLDLPVYGISLPGHFIIKFSAPYINLINKEEYFIDPFNKGVIISIKEAEEFVKKIGMTKDDFDKIPYLKTANDNEIILRVLRNLTEIYKKKKDNLKSVQLEQIMKSLT